jgi:hypothetical protein
MNPRKLRQSTREESIQENQAASEQKQAAREFNSAEELLRHDAAQTSVPEEVGARLRESIAREPPPRRSWWQRLFGG